MFKTLTQKITKRNVQIALGCLWLLDGLLQLQRQMFTKNFAAQVIAPAAQGQPAFISSPMHFVVQVILRQPALFDVCFALIQLTLGVLLLWKRTARYGVLGSVLWGLAVWYLGEGLGGLFGGQALLLTGAPGAALLYALIALGVMPHKHKAGPKTRERPAAWLSYLWIVLWMGGGLLLLSTTQAKPKMVASMVLGAADGAPGWLSAVDRHFASWLGGVGSWFIILAVILYMVIGGVVVFSRRWRFAGIGMGILLALVFWVVGQSLGGYYTGLATDPNTAPLIILLGIAILGTKEIELDMFRPSRFYT